MRPERFGRTMRFVTFKFISTLSLLLVVSALGMFQSRGAEYYSAAELSYRSGDYGRALMYYELAIIYDKTIESDDPNIKLKMGVSAYMIGDYDKALTYLSGYDTEFAKSLVESLKAKKQQQEDWKRWLSSSRVMRPEQGQGNQTKAPFQLRTLLLLVLVFTATFAALFYAELRVYKLRRRVIQLPSVGERPTETEVPTQPVVQREAKEKEAKEKIEGPVAEEFTLLPQDAKLIDFEQLLNSEVDIFKDIFEPLAAEGKGEKSPTERESLIEEVMNETRDLLAEVMQVTDEATKLIEETSAKAKEEKVFEVPQSDNIDKLERQLLEKLGTIVQTMQAKLGATSSESIEEFTLMQKPFQDFDLVENITTNETKILSKKLVAALKERMGGEEGNSSN